MSQTLIVQEVNLKGFNLSVTARDNGEDASILEELTYRTIGAWLWIASRLEQNVYTIPDELRGSVESRYAADINKDNGADSDAPTAAPFIFQETFGDARVTIWDSYRGQKRVNFHLNSDDDLQRAVDTWCATQKALERAFEKWGDKVANVIQDTPPVSTQSPAPTDRPATPKNAPSAPVAPHNSARNGYSPEDAHAEVAAQGKYFTKKEAIAKLNAGDSFKMKIVQIEKHSKDGSDFYDFYEPYGGKAGQFSATSIFVDNEIALNNGLIAYLDTFGIKLGQALTGNWILNCSVGKPKTKTVKGEEKTFTNIYVNSFVGQTQKVKQSSGEYTYDIDLDSEHDVD